MRFLRNLKETLFYDFPNFIHNIWKFRKALWNHHSWDYAGTLEFIEIGVSDISKNIENRSNEVAESRLKKVKQMNRAVEILTNIREDRYFDLVEAEMGRKYNTDKIKFVESEDYPSYYELIDFDTKEEKEFNSSYFKRVRELEETEWFELWQILCGQDYKKFNPEADWEEQFDGSGIKCWWN